MEERSKPAFKNDYVREDTVVFHINDLPVTSMLIEQPVQEVQQVPEDSVWYVYDEETGRLTSPVTYLPSEDETQSLQDNLSKSDIYQILKGL